MFLRACDTVAVNINDKVKKTALLPSLTPLEVLRILARAAESMKQGSATGRKELARVTLYLGSTSFSGFVLGIKEETEGCYVLFIEHEDGQSAQKGISAIYLPIWNLMAIKVHEVDQYLHILTEGKIETQATGPGIVGLRNKIAEEVVRLRTVVQADIKLEVSWETLTQDEVSLLGLFELIDLVMPVIIDLISDEFRRIAFKTIINAIRFQNAAEADIILDGNILIIRADLRSRADGRFSREECEEAIASIL